MYARLGVGPYRAPAGHRHDADRGCVGFAADNRVDGGSCVQKYVRMVKENPLYAVSGLLIVIVIVFIAISSGDNKGEKQARSTTSTTAEKKKGKRKLPKGRKVREAPVGSSGVIDEANREGPFVVAQARGTIRNPGLVRLRVNASPRQRVTVDWQLSCFRDRRVKVGRGRYRAKAPSTRSISVPMSGAETCIATAGAQLTRYGRGRVTVAVVAG
jgi:hypothetical protein